MSNEYSAPVDKLLTYGDCNELDLYKWPDYLELGLTEEHIPELIRMATDDAFLDSDSGSLEVWAPIHAWRALGQLQAVEAVQPLLGLLDEWEDDDWVVDEVPRVFEMIGVETLPALIKYLADESYGFSGKIGVAGSIKNLGVKYPPGSS